MTKRPSPEYYIVTDVLDLHGFFPEQVPEMIQAFIENAVSLGLHRTIVILKPDPGTEWSNVGGSTILLAAPMSA